MKKLFLILSACMTVLMVSCVKEPPTIDVQSVTVTPDEKTLEIGGTVTLTAAVLPDDATDKTVVWASSDAQVASVTENGVVKALKAGTANITATSGSASGKAVITVVPVIGTAEASYTVGNEGGKVNIAVVAQSVNIDADAQKWLSAKVEADKIVTAFIENNNLFPWPSKEYGLYANQFHFDTIYLQHGVLHIDMPWKYSPEKIIADKIVVASDVDYNLFRKN